MLKFSTLRRALAGATVTVGLLAAAASASAAPVSWVPGAPGGGGGGVVLEPYTLTAGPVDDPYATQTCTPVPSVTTIFMNPNFGTPPTVALQLLQMQFDAPCTPRVPSTVGSLSLKGPMLGSVNAGVYTFTGPGFNATGNMSSIRTNPSAPAVPPVVGVWTNHAAPDGVSRLKFNNVLIGYTDSAGTVPVRLTATIRWGTTYAGTPTLAPRP